MRVSLTMDFVKLIPVPTRPIDYLDTRLRGPISLETGGIRRVCCLIKNGNLAGQILISGPKAPAPNTENLERRGIPETGHSSS